MKLVVDMNLSPDWIPMLQAQGWAAKHWSEIGPANAPDTELNYWAHTNEYIILTQDLDFTRLLFSSGNSGPSVVLLRLKDEFDTVARETIFRALHQAKAALASGALLIIS
jgi:predicted nuclease of predicted toxin-antitoxin system